MIKLSKLTAKLSSPGALLLLATALAGGVAAVAYLYLQQREETLKTELSAKSRSRQTPRVAVVVPKNDVGVNTVLNSTVFVSRAIEADLVYPDTLLARDFRSLEGLRLARPVLGGRPVRLTDLQQPDVNDVAAILPAGMRAVTIGIDNLNSIAQTLRPHHRVDIFLLSNIPAAHDAAAGADDKAREHATLFMQNMQVLATGQEFQDVNMPVENSSKMVRPGEVEGTREKGFDSITLLVRPAEAAKLLIGQKMGSYRVVLRGTKDNDVLALKPLSAGDLMPGVARRDGAIEFIVGGLGRREQIVSKLAVPPSQALAQALATLPSATHGDNPASPANQPIPVLRASR